MEEYEHNQQHRKHTANESIKRPVCDNDSSVCPAVFSGHAVTRHQAMERQFRNDDMIFETLKCVRVFGEATGPDANLHFQETFLPLMERARQMQAAGMDAAETFEIIGRLWTEQVVKYGELVGVKEKFHVINGQQQERTTVNLLDQTIQDIRRANAG